jgi:hypothetical protein
VSERYWTKSPLVAPHKAQLHIRALSLNRCAGGADASRHVFNAALDFRIGPEQPSDAIIN